MLIETISAIRFFNNCCTDKQILKLVGVFFCIRKKTGVSPSLPPTPPPPHLEPVDDQFTVQV